MTTNFPIYLTKYLLADGVGYINTGAIDSLTKPVGVKWRDIINSMWTVVDAVA